MWHQWCQEVHGCVCESSVVNVVGVNWNKNHQSKPNLTKEWTKTDQAGERQWDGPEQVNPGVPYLPADPPLCQPRRETQDNQQHTECRNHTPNTQKPLRITNCVCWVTSPDKNLHSSTPKIQEWWMWPLLLPLLLRLTVIMTIRMRSNYPVWYSIISVMYQSRYLLINKGVQKLYTDFVHDWIYTFFSPCKMDNDQCSALKMFIAFVTV